MHFVRLQTLEELIDKVKDRGHDFWVGTAANLEHYEAISRLGGTKIEEMFAEDVFSHCFTFVSTDIYTAANEVIEKFGLGLRRKKLPSTKATSGCVYLMVNYSRETVLQARRSKIANDSTTFRLSSEAKLRNTTIKFEECTKNKLKAVLGKTKAFWLSAFKQLTVKEAQKQIMNTSIEGQSPEKLFSHCYIMASENCRKDCDEFYESFGLGVRRTMVRAKETWGTVFALVATEVPMGNFKEEETGASENACIRADHKRLPAADQKRQQQLASQRPAIKKEVKKEITTHVIKSTQRKR